MNTSDIRDRRRRNAKRGASLGALTVALPLALTACFPLPGAGGGSAASGVGFDDVQKAVIQIESVGTFVSPEEGGYEAAGRGSGFIIDDSGIAVTNNHVVVGAGTLKVWRGGDTSDTLNAKVLGSSECLDLAVIDLQGDGYPALGWHEGKIPTAMDVYAAGFPLGDPEFTMTRGIVSKADTPTDTPWASLDHVIEHDAKIRSGNSGGPLVDEQGRIVGVNYAGNDQYDTNLAIHRDEVEEAIESLKKGEDVLSLGINGTGLTDEEGTGLGIWVNSVASGSTADKAGVKPGDLLTRMEGVTLGTDGTMADYCDVLRTHGQDATLSVELYRPSEDVYYDGQFNGDAVEAVSVLSQTDQNAGTQSGGGDSSAASDVEYTEITDDSGGLLVEAPAAWNQVDGSAMTDGKGNVYKRIDASPDLAGFNAGWDVPGVSVIASDTAATNTTPQEWLDLVAGAAQQGGCQLATHDVFEDGYHTGVFDYYTGCGDNDADYLMVAALANDGSYLTALAVQALTEQDLDAIDHAVGSFIAQF
ncbi:serine protease Do [Diaminobutyricimonas aerilata]|uniref:Serine protease Do n=1 Tax=Diaminobutyricimonas aerilata TaxID=1162967 RepID=A0A2M9CN59_9MICO|nr:S1C family serine protease [Diaminobutyricimonas aerilata]PJJ73347.1 serine protease Do [Diaminobutyricimonas aerilata]